MKYIYQTRGEFNATCSSGYLKEMRLPIDVFDTTKGLDSAAVFTLYTEEEVEAHLRAREEEDAALWRDTEPMKSLREDVGASPGQSVEKDHINPDHYKNYMVITDGPDPVVELQWMEAQQFKPFFRTNPRAFVQAVLMQSDKYISRLGQKDDESQEIQKALWYLKFATAYVKNDMKPIWIRDISFILDDAAEHTNELKKELEEAKREVFRRGDIIDEARAEVNEKLGQIAELVLDKERLARDRDILLHYAKDTVDGYSPAEWSDSSLSTPELEELEKITGQKINFRK